MNKVILSGRATKDPEIKYSGDMAIAKVTIAVDRKTKEGDEKKSDFIGCTAFGAQASFLEKYFHKGDGMNIEGRIQTGSYKSKEGNTVYTTDVVIDAIEFPLSNKNSNGAQNSQPTNINQNNGFVNAPADIDDLPFN